MTLIALAGIGLWAWEANNGRSELEERDQRREREYRSDLHGLMENNSINLSDEQLESAVTFGHEVCSEFRAGITYEEALDKYGPSGDAFPADNKPTDAWIAQVSDGVSQIILVGSMLAIAAQDLCPEAGVLDD